MGGTEIQDSKLSVCQWDIYLLKRQLDIWAVGLAQWTPKGQMVKGSG